MNDNGLLGTARFCEVRCVKVGGALGNRGFHGEPVLISCTDNDKSNPIPRFRLMASGAAAV